MSNKSELTPSLSPAIQRVSTALRRAGTIGFWVQIFLGVVSALILGGAAISQNIGAGGDAGSGFGIFLAICGLVTLGVSVYFCFRYVSISKLLESGDPTMRPSKPDTLQVIRLGLIVNLIGMFLTILGAEATVGVVLGKALAQPSGLTTYDPSLFVRAIDIFIVQANTNTIAAHFSGIVASLWLLNRITR